MNMYIINYICIYTRIYIYIYMCWWMFCCHIWPGWLCGWHGVKKQMCCVTVVLNKFRYVNNNQSYLPTNQQSSNHHIAFPFVAGAHDSLHRGCLIWVPFLSVLDMHRISVCTCFFYALSNILHIHINTFVHMHSYMYSMIEQHMAYGVTTPYGKRL